MGSLQAREMMNGLDADQFLVWHLQYNHIPPIHPDFVKSAKRAVELVLAEEYDTDITMPNGLVLPAGEIIEGLHLWDFVEQERHTSEHI